MKITYFDQTYNSWENLFKIYVNLFNICLGCYNFCCCRIKFFSVVLKIVLHLKFQYRDIAVLMT